MRSSPSCSASVGEGVVVKQPFRCDYGGRISIGAGTFVNFDCVDARRRGDHDRPQLPDRPPRAAADRDPPDRPGARAATGWESAAPITIGDNVWLGGGAIVCPGVEIGADTVVGAGARGRPRPSRPASSPGGVPARVLREIGEDDRVDVPGP